MSCLSAHHRLAVADSGANSETNGAETDASFRCHHSLSAWPDFTSTALTLLISQHIGWHSAFVAAAWENDTGTSHDGTHIQFHIVSPAVVLIISYKRDYY